jgi:hypothetical protein
MKPLSLNMDRYRKVADDGEKSTLEQHDTGHTITIAHKALPREQRNYLRALPLYSADHADPEQAKMAKGGRINSSYGDAIEERGDKEREAEDKDINSNPKYKKQVAQALQSKYDKDIKPRGDKKLSDAMRAHYDEGTPDEPVSKDDSPTPGATPININIGPQSAVPTQAQPTNQIASQAEEPKKQEEEKELPMPIEAPPMAPEPPQAGTSDSLTDAQRQLDAMQGKGPPPSDAQPASAQEINPTAPETPTYLGGVGQEYKGLAQRAQAQGALGATSAPLEDQAARDRAQLAAHTQEQYNTLNQERLANAQDVRNGLVNPNKYWDNHSKLRTGLGLILAGFNPTNRPNAALEFLQNNIQRDTEAQKANLGAREDILAHTMQQFGNSKASTEFVNVLKTDQVAAELRAAAARSQNAQQAAGFNTLAGQLQQASAQKMLPLAAMQGAFQAMRSGTDPSQMLPGLRSVQPEMAKAIEEHLYPGEGYSDVPLSEDVRNKLTSQSNILKKTNTLQNWIDSNTIGGQFSPAHRGEGEALALELQQAYRQGINASTSESEQGLINKFISQSPGGFLSSYMNDPKLKAVSSSIKDNMDIVKAQHGFHPFAGAQTQQAMNNQQQLAQAATAPMQTQEGKGFRKMWSPKLNNYVMVPQ